MIKKHLSLADIDEQSAIELPDRNLFAIARAVGLGAGGLVGAGIGAAVAADLNDVIDVNVEDSTICVNVAAVGSAAAC
jgi:hypothetical protein